MAAPACGSCTAPVPDGYLCQGCTRELARHLLTAVSIAQDLDDATARLLKRGAAGKSTSPEPPLPIDLAASNTASELRVELAVWAYKIRVNPSDTPVPDIRGLARWLAGHLEQLRQLERAGDAHRQVRACVLRALAVIDRLPERAPAGQCEACGAQLLAELGADEARCACGTLAQALNAKRRERAAAADVLGTPAELAAVLATLGYHVVPATISAWGGRGQIERRAGGMYRLSEALTMAAKMGTRRARVGG